MDGGWMLPAALGMAVAGTAVVVGMPRQSTIPASWASSPAWVRLTQPSLSSMRETWPLIVASDR